MSVPLETLAREVVAWMKAESAETQAEIYLSHDEDRLLSRRGGERDSVEASETAGAAVRVVRDGRVGFASAGGADLPGIRDLYARALEQLPFAEPDRRRELPGPRAFAADAGLAASLWDESLFTASWPSIERKMVAAESAARAEAGAAKVIRAEYAERRSALVVAGTGGLFASERGGSADFSIVVAAESGPDTQLGEGLRIERFAAALDCVAAGREAGRRAKSLLGAKRAMEGRRSVLFEPWVGGEFLELISELLSADEAQGGRSLLAGKIGRTVASSLVTLRDDPRRRGGLGSRQVDDEGLLTRDKAMIEEGILKERSEERRVGKECA